MIHRIYSMGQYGPFIRLLYKWSEMCSRPVNTMNPHLSKMTQAQCILFLSQGQIWPTHWDHFINSLTTLSTIYLGLTDITTSLDLNDFQPQTQTHPCLFLVHAHTHIQKDIHDTHAEHSCSLPTSHLSLRLKHLLWESDSCYLWLPVSPSHM